MNALYCINCNCRTPRNFADERVFDGVYCARCAPKITGEHPRVKRGIEGMNLNKTTVGIIAQMLQSEREQREALAFVRQVVPPGELWAQLAEEATELAHAALKYRRATEGVNPTPVDPDTAFASITEEVADVLLLVHVLSLDVEPTATEMLCRRKLLRWSDRLQGYWEEAKP